jgi:hypothetical protein
MPVDRVQLQQFLGMVNFYHSFLPGMLWPLMDVLQGPGGKHENLNRTQAINSAFCCEKQLMCLAHLDPAVCSSPLRCGTLFGQSPLPHDGISPAGECYDRAIPLPAQGGLAGALLAGSGGLEVPPAVGPIGVKSGPKRGQWSVGGRDSFQSGISYAAEV